jgi:hypothetical protein
MGSFSLFDDGRILLRHQRTCAQVTDMRRRPSTFLHSPTANNENERREDGQRVLAVQRTRSDAPPVGARHGGTYLG